MSDLHEVLLSMKIEMEIGSDPLHKKKKKVTASSVFLTLCAGRKGGKGRGWRKN
jgi:hypothetical protein